MGLSKVTLSLTLAALLSACANLTEDASLKTDKPSSNSSQPPPNYLAIQNWKPLGSVEGKLNKLNEDLYASDVFSTAIDYAAAMESYSLLVWHDGAIRLEQYYREFDANLKPETASMHKSVLGLLFAAAIEDGFIKSADDRIGNYIDAWNSLPEGDITIEQLLTMSSGLGSLSREGGVNSESFKFVRGELDARSTLLGLRLEGTAGSTFSYANTNSQLLGLVLEAATGQPYAQYLSQRLWQPLGADDASVWYFEENGFPRTYASLLARSRDWLKVGLLIKNGGLHQGQQIIAPELISAMIKQSATNPNYGWQIWLGNEYEEKRYYNDLKIGFGVPMAEPFKVDDMIYFDGFGGQRVYISKSEDLVIVRTGDTRLDWDDSQLPNMIIETVRNLN